jgi:hemerythrin
MTNNQLPTRPAPATGSDSVDAEHGIQLGLLDACRTALNRNREGASELMEQLYTYSQAHFLSEQLLMRLAARADYEGHVLEHERLLQQLDGAREKLGQREFSASEDALRLHEEDLINHIRSWDRSIG